MSDTLECPGCGSRIESGEALEATTEVAEVEVAADDSIQLFGNRDLFMCKSCKKPLGVARK